MAAYSKNVYLCYRHGLNSYQARNVRDELDGQDGFEVLMALEPIEDDADFEEALEELSDCAHVVVVLTNGMLEPCHANPDDPICRLIAAALEQDKNVVPLFMDHVDQAHERAYVSGTPSAALFSRNGLVVQPELFREAMQRLRGIYLGGADEDPDLEPIRQPARDATPASSPPPPPPPEAQQWIDRGTVAGQRGDYAGAIMAYTEALTLSPDIALAYYGRGLARQHMGDLEGAERDFDAALELNPDYVEAYNNRGRLRGLRGDIHGALRDYTSITRLDPGYARAYYNRANQYLRLGDTRRAIEGYTEAIRAKPNYAAAYQNRGVVRFQSGDVGGGAVDVLRSGCWLPYVLGLALIIGVIWLLVTYVF